MLFRYSKIHSIQYYKIIFKDHIARHKNDFYYKDKKILEDDAPSRMSRFGAELLEQLLPSTSSKNVEFMGTMAKTELGEEDSYCRDCRLMSLVQDEDTGFMVCEMCGVITKQHMYTRASEAKFETNGEDNNTRSGIVTNPYMKNSGRESMISVRTKTRQSRRMQTIKNWDSVSHKDRTMNSDIKRIHKILSKYDISDKIINTTQKNYFHVINGTSKRSNNRTGLKAAAFYFAAKYHSPKSPFELKNRSKNTFFVSMEKICEIFDITQKVFSIGLKHFTTTFYTVYPALMHQLGPIMPNEYVYKFVFAIEMENYLRSFEKTLRKIVHLGLDQKYRPKSIAMGIVYITIKKFVKHNSPKRLTVEINLTEICARCDNVSVNTTRTVAKTIGEYLL